MSIAIKRYAYGLAAVFLFLSLTGCAAIPFDSLSGKKTVYPASKTQSRYMDYSGIVHVHTYHSHHSTGTFEEVAEAAKNARADFVIITDHDNLNGLEEKQEGFHGNVLMLIGTEVTTPSGHLGAFRVTQKINTQQTTSEILKQVQAAKASSFICHAHWRVNPWTDWTVVSSITGMEIFNLPAEIYEDGLWKMGMKSLVFPSGALMRSYLKRPDVLLKHWDRILATRKFVGIGSVDGHQRFRIFGKALDSYEVMFKTVQTHALAHSLTRQAIFGAFQKGHVYVGFDMVKPVKNFMFAAETPNERVIMGDVIKYKEGLKLHVSMIDQAEIHILKDGLLWKKAQGNTFEASVEKPGVYRVEVYLENKLWILSNPIYIR